jgi:hypothetical protein
MVEIDTILERSLNRAVQDCGEIVQSDIRQILLNQEAFTSSDPEVGASLGNVIPLADATPEIKRRMGFPMYAEIPRIRTGALLASISNEFGGFGQIGTFIRAADYGYEQQYGLPSNGVQPNAPRPFFGISDRALKKCEAEIEKAGSKIEEDFAGVDLGILTVS